MEAIRTLKRERLEELKLIGSQILRHRAGSVVTVFLLSPHELHTLCSIR